MGTHYPLHPLCSIFPEMSEQEFDALRDDIEQHGQRDPIVIWDGHILDGRHRMQACLALGIQPKFRTIEMTWEEAKAFVVSVNLSRRHLDATQRAIIASRLATLEKGQLASRVGSIPNAQICAFGSSPTSMATTQAEAAQKLNVSPRQVQVARKVEEVTTPELFAKCESGEISLHKAGKLAAAVPNKAEQAEIVRAGRVDEVLKKALPPEEPQALPRTNTKHTPATAQKIDRGPEITPADYPDDSTGMPLLEVVIAQHTTQEVVEALIAGLEGTQAKRVAAILRAAAEELDPQPVVIHEQQEAPKKERPSKHPTVRQLQDAATEYIETSRPAGWTPQLSTQVADWADYKQGLVGNAKVRSLKSWHAALVRIANVANTRGAGTVCEMISKAIANGWQGWEHEATSNGKPTVASTRIDTGERWDDLEYRTV